MNPVNLRVVARELETERPDRAPQPGFDRIGLLDRQVRIALVEGYGRIVSAAREQLRGFRRALDVLRGDAGDHVPGQVLDQRRQQRSSVYSRGDPLEIDQARVIKDARPCPTDRRRSMRPESCAFVRLGELELVEHVAGDARGCCSGHRQAGVVGARRVELLVPALRRRSRSSARQSAS